MHRPTMQLRAFAPRMDAAERRRPSPRYIRRRRSFTLPSVFVPALVSCNTVRIIFRRGRVCVNSRPRDPPRLDQPRPSPSLSPLAFAFPPSHPSLSFLSTALHLSLSLSRPRFVSPLTGRTRQREGEREPVLVERSGAPEMNHLKLSIFERGSCIHGAYTCLRIIVRLALYTET